MCSQCPTGCQGGPLCICGDTYYGPVPIDDDHPDLQHVDPEPRTWIVTHGWPATATRPAMVTKIGPMPEYAAREWYTELLEKHPKHVVMLIDTNTA